MKQKIKRLWSKWKAAPLATLFFVFLFGFMIFDMLWPKRDHSDLENRSLSQAPAFSWSSLFKNEWTAKYGDYVKDQFALRDSWIDLMARSEYFTAKAENNDILLGKEHMLFKKIYSMDRYAGQWSKNVKMVGQFAQRHPGKVTLLVAPSASVIYTDKLPLAVPLIDEESYLDELFEAVGQNASVIDLRPVFREHKEEYLYYRTDHHWTTQGAYLAYQQFCDQQNLVPFDLQAHKAIEVPDFYGTNYAGARTWNAEPDTITYYELPNSLTLESAREGEPREGGLYDLADFDTYDKYAAFLRGNNGYSVIEGDGEGSILVIKDSYGNCFVPFLTANYAKIGVIDFRYRRQNIEDLMKEYDQALILYNFQSFYKDSYIPCLNLNLGNKE